ncbi:hypothetical protein A7X67_12175 [Clostridium sp. W14A]|nr:hypothetical protein A7X67_12175 [Clostridium sp. W14A]
MALGHAKYASTGCTWRRQARAFRTVKHDAEEPLYNLRPEEPTFLWLFGLLQEKSDVAQVKKTDKKRQGLQVSDRMKLRDSILKEGQQPCPEKLSGTTTIYAQTFAKRWKQWRPSRLRCQFN